MATRNDQLIVFFDENNCVGFKKRNSLTDELHEKWYGVYREGVFVLNLVELAYLLSTSRVVVKNGDKDISTLQELVSQYNKCFDTSFWPMLSVFKDLRERGRRVRVLGPMKFLVKDKSGDLRLVYILEEKYSVSVNRLVELIEEARRNNLKATLAIVSLQGELTYYESNLVDLWVEKNE